jgi:hypothetical protein
MQLIKESLPGDSFGNHVDLEEQVDRENGGNLINFAVNYEVIRVTLDDDSESIIFYKDIVYFK